MYVVMKAGYGSIDARDVSNMYHICMNDRLTSTTSSQDCEPRTSITYVKPRGSVRGYDGRRGTYSICRVRSGKCVEIVNV